MAKEITITFDKNMALLHQDKMFEGKLYIPIAYLVLEKENIQKDSVIKLKELALEMLKEISQQGCGAVQELIVQTILSVLQAQYARAFSHPMSDQFAYLLLSDTIVASMKNQSDKDMCEIVERLCEGGEEPIIEIRTIITEAISNYRATYLKNRDTYELPPNRI